MPEKTLTIVPGYRPEPAAPSRLAPGASSGRGGRLTTLARVAYHVSTPVFEGPFDLLLDLINRQQVELWDVSLCSIVDAYVASLEQLRDVDLEVATEFLLIAAVLVELKARRLLPDRDDVDADEELGVWEERDLLLLRLLECKTFKNAAQALNLEMERASRCYLRVAGPEERYVALTPDLLEGVTPERLRDAFRSASAPKPVIRVMLDHVAPIRASVTDAVELLVARLPGLRRTTFRRLTEGVTERMEIIVRFLAVLEMYKRGLVDLDQAGKLGDLEVRWLAGEGVDVELAYAGIDDYDGGATSG